MPRLFASRRQASQEQIAQECQHLTLQALSASVGLVYVISHPVPCFCICNFVYLAYEYESLLHLQYFLLPHPNSRNRVAQPARGRLRSHSESVGTVQQAQGILYVARPNRSGLGPEHLQACSKRALGERHLPLPGVVRRVALLYSWFSRR